MTATITDVAPTVRLRAVLREIDNDDLRTIVNCPHAQFRRFIVAELKARRLRP